MASKVAEVQRLLAEGFELEDVDEAQDLIEAHFRRGPTVRTITFLPQDAQALLLLPWPKQRQR